MSEKCWFACKISEILNSEPTMHCTRPSGGGKKHAVGIPAVIPHAGSDWRQLATISINITWVISGRFAVAYWQIFKSDRNAIYRKPSQSHQRVTLAAVLFYFLTLFITFLWVFLRARCVPIQRTLPSAGWQEMNDSLKLLGWRFFSGKSTIPHLLTSCWLTLDSKGGG